MYNPYDPHYQAMLRAAQQAAAQGSVSGLDLVGGIPAYPYVQGFDLVGAEMAKAALMAPQRGAPYMPMATPMAHGVQIPAPGVYSTENSARVPRRKTAGFPLATIPIGQTSTVAQMLPTEVIRPERLVVVDTFSGQLNDVLIDDIKIGSQSQNIGQGPISAEVFATTAFDTLIEGNTLNLGVPISISLRLAQPAQVARTFALTVIGRSVQG